MLSSGRLFSTGWFGSALGCCGGLETLLLSSGCLFSTGWFGSASWPVCAPCGLETPLLCQNAFLAQAGLDRIRGRLVHFVFSNVVYVSYDERPSGFAAVDMHGFVNLPAVLGQFESSAHLSDPADSFRPRQAGFHPSAQRFPDSCRPWVSATVARRYRKPACGIDRPSRRFPHSLGRNSGNPRGRINC